MELCDGAQGKGMGADGGGLASDGNV